MLSEALWCSRFREYKREADRDANWMRRNGGTHVKVSGKRGGPWEVRAKISACEFVKFVAIEAKREQGN